MSIVERTRQRLQEAPAGWVGSNTNSVVAPEQPERVFFKRMFVFLPVGMFVVLFKKADHCSTISCIALPTLEGTAREKIIELTDRVRARYRLNK